MSGDRHVEPRELGFDAIRFGAPSHRRRTHDGCTVLKDHGAVRCGCFVRIVPVRIENDGLDAVIAQRFLQDGMLFYGPREDGAGLGGQRARAFDARVGRYQQRRTQSSGGRTDQPRSEMHATVCHLYVTPFRERYAAALQTRRRSAECSYRIARYGCGSGASVKKSAMSVASKSFKPSGGKPKISSSVFTTLGTERWACPTYPFRAIGETTTQ